MRDGFIKVAAGSPKIRVADCRYNAEQCFTMMREAYRQGVRVLCLPELCLTGVTCGDLFWQDTLIRGADDALATVLKATRNLDMITALGLPIRSSFDNKLYNCCALIQKGRILALIPKACLSPKEQRWFAPFRGNTTAVTAAGQETSLAGQTVLASEDMSGLRIGVEIGGDLWSPIPPSGALALNHAVLILHPSSDWEGAERAHYRRRLVCGQSAKLMCGYISAGTGEGESTTDEVYSGHCMIAENGALLAERRFSPGLAVSELDLERLLFERRRSGLWSNFPISVSPCTHMAFHLEPSATALTRHVSPSPFVPENPADRAARCEELLKISAAGLAKRLEHTHVRYAVIGLSGGLDSTLAILITVIAMRLLGRPTGDILAVTMPCFGTTDRTRDNAVELATQLGCTLRRIDISNTVRSHFKDICQSMDDQDVTYENGQARERTQVLMDIANQVGGMVIGTGDLSELALGWCTYNGDHMSMYAVNAGIPKTMVRHLVAYICGDKAVTEPRLSDVLTDILNTPVSPELLPAIEGKISQKTEELVGPYELHDFFLYCVLRWGFSPRKVLRLAEKAFVHVYDRETILKWLRTFYRRFFSQQFKRSCLPDGPKVGSVSISPRGDLQMPSDAVSALWMDELDAL